MTKVALWRTLYTPGHDAARLFQVESGWRLEGTAVYLRDGEPSCVRYTLELGPDWSTRSGSIEGFIGARAVCSRIQRDAQGWTLNEVRQSGVENLVDLDFGFTPATNHPQLRRMALRRGQSEHITVAWMDADSEKLEPLPQVYRRVSEHAYDYESPQGPYRATLQIAPSGFVSLYPELWEMELNAV
ncbi:putative glycolipid-binding domain-containing protein [Ensifer sp. IC4062]|nr:putative glycolipid-binding domain-containing protein [Ensifer sp. IC4062]